MTLGVLSDTHDHLDSRIARLFRGVDRILHAGDVCRPDLVARLFEVAPVTVARGNNDSHTAWRESEFLELGLHRLLIEHIVHPHHPSPAFLNRLRYLQPTVVVFGHTHCPLIASIDGILYLNPGSAGQSRGGVPRSICLLHLGGDLPQPEMVTLG